MKHRYTEQELRNAISSSRSIHQALVKLGITSYGGSYRVIHRAVRKYKIDISHFTGQGWNREQKLGPKRPLSDYLTNNGEYKMQSHKLRLRLLSEKVFPHKCSKCENEIWNNFPIPLELDHIDGNHDNNELSNLRLLCPNCHSQTATYSRRKRHNT